MTVHRLAVLAALLCVAAWPAAAATLKTSVVVEDSQIRLGDLFQGAGKHAETAIAQSPPPGRRIVLDANWLYRVAHAYKVDWRPASNLDQATVERASQVLGPERLADALIPALQDQMASLDPLEIEFDNRLVQINLPTSMPATIGIGTLDFDRRSNRFSAVLTAPRDHPDAIRIAVTGKAYRLVQVPVPTRRIREGEVIRDRDLDMQMVREDSIDRTAFLDPERVVGMSPRRVLDEGRPVRSADVRKPLIVQKGALVTILYRTPYMMLSARGRAMQDGAQGESVRVTNTQSKQTIEGIVTASGEISVSPDSRLAMQ
ncbi:MAG: flagellar basal body P-ring formation chaperone FlgA [Alphaproteobacteria bacterium]